MLLEFFFTPAPAGVVSYFLATGWILASLRFIWTRNPNSRNTATVLVILVGVTAVIPAGATIFDQLCTFFGDGSQSEAKSTVPFVATMICLALLMAFGWSMLINMFQVLFEERPHLLGALEVASLSFLSLWTAALLSTIELGGKTNSGSHPLKTIVECLLIAGFVLAWMSATICGRAEKRYEDQLLVR